MQPIPSLMLRVWTAGLTPIGLTLRLARQYTEVRMDTLALRSLLILLIIVARRPRELAVGSSTIVFLASCSLLLFVSWRLFSLFLFVFVELLVIAGPLQALA